METLSLSSLFSFAFHQYIAKFPVAFLSIHWEFSHNYFVLPIDVNAFYVSSVFGFGIPIVLNLTLKLCIHIYNNDKTTFNNFLSLFLLNFFLDHQKGGLNINYSSALHWTLHSWNRRKRIISFTPMTCMVMRTCHKKLTIMVEAQEESKWVSKKGGMASW